MENMSRSSGTNSSSEKSRPSRFALSHQRVKMMNLDESNNKPAATVIRPSPGKLNKAGITAADDGCLEKIDSQEIATNVFKVEQVCERTDICTRDNRSDHQPKRDSGFPSLDAPIGTFARSTVNSGPMNTKPLLGNRCRPSEPKTDDTNKSNSTNASGNLLQNMTPQEIQEGLDEIQQILSPSSIAFLKARGKGTGSGGAGSRSTTETTSPPILRTHSLSISQSKISSTPSLQENLGHSSPYYTNDVAPSSKLQDSLLSHESDLDVNNVPSPYDPLSLQDMALLLRSTSYRQTVYGAKRIDELLQEYVSKEILQTRDDQSTMDNTVRFQTSNLPIHLPVALRCLLDLPSPQKHEILHSHVLRSIYFLLVLSQPFPCCMDIGSDFRMDDLSFFQTVFERIHYDYTQYQVCFLDDSVPLVVQGGSNTSPLMNHEEENDEEEHLHSLLEEKDSDTRDKEPNYSTIMTDSQSESATKDGQAFYRDPIWTLLARMRILPCLSKILQSMTLQYTTRDTSFNPPTSFTIHGIQAICGILNLISIHNPGAACAIAQHVDLLPSLVSLTLQPHMIPSHVKDDDKQGIKDKSMVQNIELIIPMLRLLITISQQSRVAASMPIISTVCMDYLYPILAVRAESAMDIHVQRESILFWRTLLRYGLATAHVGTMLPMSLVYLSTTLYDGQDSVTADYISAFATFCECMTAYVIETQRGVAVGDFSTPILRLSDEEKGTLDGAFVWLVPQVYKCADFLSEIESKGPVWGVSTIRVVTARWKLLSAFSRFMSVTENTATINTLEFPYLKRRVIDCLHQFLHGSIFLRSLKMVLYNIFSSLWDHRSFLESHTELFVSCSLVETILSTIWNFIRKREGSDEHEIEKHQNTTPEVQSILESSFSMIIGILTQEENNIQSQPQAFSPESDSFTVQSECLVRSHFALTNYLSTVVYFVNTDKLHPSSSSSTIRSLVLTLIGRLRTGHEALLMTLLQQHWIFSSIDSIDIQMKGPSTFFKSFLLQQLFYTDQAKCQLSHSYRRLGLISRFNEGPFHLETLRPIAGMSQQERELIVLQLPLGDIWLYRFLSSAVIVESSDSRSREDVIQNTVRVVTSSFEFILFLEGQNMIFTNQINVGIKLYHLFNTLLYPEEILQDKNVSSHFMELFSLYTKQIPPRHDTAMKGFFSACYQHSALSRKRNSTKDEQVGDDILSLLNPTVSPDSLLTSEELKTMEDFITDLSSVLLEYGALYEPFIHTFRFFLRPWFPSRLRKSTISKVHDLLQRLTTVQEDEDESYVLLTEAVAYNLSGGLPTSQDAPRDPHDFLDDLVFLLKENARASRKSDADYVYLYCVASLARCLASNVLNCECGLERMRSRLRELENSTVANIVSTANIFVCRGTLTALDIAVATVEVCLKTMGTMSFFQNLNGDRFNIDDLWDLMVLELRNNSIQ